MASPPPVPFTPAANGVELPFLINFTVVTVIVALSTPELPIPSKFGRNKLFAEIFTPVETFIDPLVGVELTTLGI